MNTRITVIDIYFVELSNLFELTVCDVFFMTSGSAIITFEYFLIYIRKEIVIESSIEFLDQKFLQSHKATHLTVLLHLII